MTDSELIEARDRLRRRDQAVRLRAEESDVAKLQQVTLTSIVATVSGAKEERLAKERADAELHDAPQRFEQAMAAAEAALQAGGDPRAADLAKLAEQLGDVEADLREHEEARQTGIEALAAVEGVLEHLGGARRWSTFAFEHDRLNQAHGQAWQAQRRLDVFARQLADVGVDVRPQLPTIDTRWFVDMFFDNVITDAMRHNRIERTGEEIAAMAAWIRSVLKPLDDGRSRLRALRNDLAAQRRRLHGLV